MNIPKYVWKYGLILLFISEIRKCADLYLEYLINRNNKEDDEERPKGSRFGEPLPESVKHIYS